jgi:ATP-binding cassette subfamily F protein 3
MCVDEPTNHLDLESVEWLEEFLRQQNIPMVIVSHDREFLDRVCTKIVDAEGGICNEYDGNYSRFLELKKGKSLCPGMGQSRYCAKVENAHSNLTRLS